MEREKGSFHKAAGAFIRKYYEETSESHIYFIYGITCEIAKQAKLLAKHDSLKGMDYQNAIVAAWFRFAGMTELEKRTDAMNALLQQYFEEVDYPAEGRAIVLKAINISLEFKYADSKLYEIICDAINSRLARQNFLEMVVLIKEEMNRISSETRTELFFLQYYRDVFLRAQYYTRYARENYAGQKEKNFQIVDKRINKIGHAARLNGGDNPLSKGELLSNKEAEEMFKIAFRNYNHLISAADSKAALLIRVSSIIISVMLAFGIAKIKTSPGLLWPIVILLTTSLATVLLAILASKPRRNSFHENKLSLSYQQFFFGSFDLIDPSFREVSWDSYYTQLTTLFDGSKNRIYLEAYKESYNVRKVLLKKFTYLSAAYWTFILGLLVSIFFFALVMLTG